jgi:hypothetical protein
VEQRFAREQADRSSRALTHIARVINSHPNRTLGSARSQQVPERCQRPRAPQPAPDDDATRDVRALTDLVSSDNRTGLHPRN